MLIKKSKSGNILSARRRIHAKCLASLPELRVFRITSLTRQELSKDPAPLTDESEAAL